SMRCFILAAAVLALAAPGQAAVYAPSFDGPNLDASITVQEPTGLTHSVGFGTLVLSKAQGVGSDGPVYPMNSFYSADSTATEDFSAQLTVNTAQLGKTSFVFQGYGMNTLSLTISSQYIVGFISLQYSTSGRSIVIPAVGTLFDLKITRVANLASVFANDQLLLSDYIEDQTTGFGFGTSNLFVFEPVYTTALVRNFTVTTPDLCSPAAPCTSGTPEPASWALLIAGFGPTGAAMRGRRAAQLKYSRRAAYPQI
ncbi:MAG: PEPxxWA-CTERM sorting domain-containing protein, partial [Sandarakinorhabdus sp.]|nr:PEPxxWA-CTERM sorting domain-containing protein [Sandarakinorhabdus sp.]